MARCWRPCGVLPVLWGLFAHPVTDGFRESTQSWREVFATTREQRCWVHKTMNVLNAMPKSMQSKAKDHLHDIWQAATNAKANTAFDFFVEPP